MKTSRNGSGRTDARERWLRLVPSPALVERDFQNHAAVLELHHAWDGSQVDDLIEAVARAVERDRTTLVFDLGKLTDLDSAVLSALVDVQTMADRSGWSVLVVLPALSYVREAYAAAGLDRRCATYRALAAALLAVHLGSSRRRA